MKRKILIIGGTRFLGPRLINLLIKNGDEVCCFNRGNNYGYNIPRVVKQIIGDRENMIDLEKLKKYTFDLIYDMCCYTPEHAEKITSVFSINSKHIIFLSTAAVYKKSLVYPLKEQNEKGKWESFGDYGTNKSKAEEAFIKNSKKNGNKLTIFRPVYILGKDNYFDRENYAFSRILKKQKILIPGNGNALIQFCFVDETAEILYKIPILQRNKIEVLNIGGNDYVTIRGFMELCASIVGENPRIHFLNTKDFGFNEEQFRDYLYPFPNTNLILSNTLLKESYNVKFKNLENGLIDIYRYWLKNWKGNVMRSEEEKWVLKEINFFRKAEK